ncbi:hypothetical protein B0G71_2395 [Paraburkholderia sp. BL27I4N3]|nr:hypothetical protein B0G71_2395 [Paraburkholderia sp. BL27I4N3]
MKKHDPMGIDHPASGAMPQYAGVGGEAAHAAAGLVSCVDHQAARSASSATASRDAIVLIRKR